MAAVAKADKPAYRVYRQIGTFEKIFGGRELALHVILRCRYAVFSDEQVVHRVLRDAELQRQVFVCQPLVALLFNVFLYVENNIVGGLDIRRVLAALPVRGVAIAISNMIPWTRSISFLSLSSISLPSAVCFIWL